MVVGYFSLPPTASALSLQQFMNTSSNTLLPTLSPQALSVMQPYFFPYLGYFALIKHTDFFVSFDPVQYISKGWMNRNRVLKPNEGWQYLTAPVQKQPQNTLIKDILVVPGDEWKVKILRQLEHYKKRSPYYEPVNALLEDCFANSELSLSRLNLHYLNKVCAYLEMPFHYAMFSDMDLKLGSVKAADEWALRTTQALGATTYINQPGGRTFFNPAKYVEASIDLKFLDFNLTPYDQRRPAFEVGLSILDVLMFNSPEQVRAMLENVHLSDFMP